MADKYLNNTGLQYFYNRIKTIFASKTEFETLSDKVDEIISEGGEPNVIDTVKVNGTALVPDSQKAVNVTVPTEQQIKGFADDQIATSIASQTTSSIASKEYVTNNGGKIDVIKVNGTAQTITNKEVDITMPTKVSDLTNDSSFQNATEVATAIATALANSGDPYMPESDIQQLIDDELAGITGIEFEVVQTLPASGVKGTIYLVHKDGQGLDIYDEYVWVTPTGATAHWEKIGTTDIDLSGYWAIADLVAITTAEIDTILA